MDRAYHASDDSALDVMLESPRQPPDVAVPASPGYTPPMARHAPSPSANGTTSAASTAHRGSRRPTGSPVKLRAERNKARPPTGPGGSAARKSKAKKDSSFMGSGRPETPTQEHRSQLGRRSPTRSPSPVARPLVPDHGARSKHEYQYGQAWQHGGYGST